MWGWIFGILVLLGGWQCWDGRSISPPPGILAPNDPVQTNLEEKKVYQHGEYKLEALADFDVEARVLAKEIYRFDRGADLIPVDLALGWGAMSDSAVLEKLSISQSGRFYFYRWEKEPPLPKPEIVSHSANMHLIPVNSSIEKSVKRVRVGQVIHIKGQLVEARAPDGSSIRSSLTRSDTGAGACEVIRVELIEVR